MSPVWELREIPADLASEYRDNGLWRNESLAQTLIEAYDRCIGVPVTIDSAVRPWSGTHGDLIEAAATVASSLRELGIGVGDVIVIRLPNWREAVVAYWASILLSAVTVPVVHQYQSRELLHILRETRARVLITASCRTDDPCIADVAKSVGDLPELDLLFEVNDAGPSVSSAANFASLEGVGSVQPFVVDAVSVQAPAVIAYTSGSTSAPKGVIHTHETLGYELAQFDAIFEDHNQRERALVGAPLGHMNGMLVFMAAALRGQPATLLDGWDPDSVLASLAAQPASFMGGPTYFLKSLIDHPGLEEAHLGALRIGMIGLGGTTVPVGICERAAELGITVGRAYGLTEHPSLTGARSWDPEAKRHHTEGRPFRGAELRIVDERRRDVEVGRPGEVLTRGGDLCMGYTNPELNDAFDSEGWFATGDIGTIDADGYLTIVDRKKDIIIRGGENVSAREVEGLLAEIDGVIEVAVVAAPDERLGEHGCTFVRLAPTSRRPTLVELTAVLDAKGLAKQKWPEELRFIDEFPRTPSGKVQKSELRRLAKQTGETENVETAGR